MSDVKLFVDKVFTWVSTDMSEVYAVIDNSLSVLVPGRHFSWKFKAKIWDGKHHFYDLMHQRFMTGFLDEIVEKLQSKGYTVEIEYTEGALVESIEIDNVELNGIDIERFQKIQLPLVKEILRKGRAAVRLATGGGKTELTASVAKVLSDKNVLILVHRLELLAQTITRLENRLGEKVGCINSAGIDVKRVTVGMVMSVWSKRQKLRNYLKNEVDVVISDECHRSGSNTWQKLLKVTNASYRLGLSGSPLKGDEVRDRMLIGLTGGIIQGVGVKELADAGYAVLPEVRIIDASNVFKEKFSSKMKYPVVSKEVFGSNDLWGLCYKVVQWHDKKGLIFFTERVDVCLGLYDYFKSRGVNVAVSYGGIQGEERLSILDDFKNKKIDVLIVTTILDEGVDVSSISGVVFMSSGKSIVRILQRVGRGVRVEEGKEKVIVYDFAINAPYLKKHLLVRYDIYSKEKFDVGLWKLENDNFVKI